MYELQQVPGRLLLSLEARRDRRQARCALFKPKLEMAMEAMVFVLTVSAVIVALVTGGGRVRRSLLLIIGVVVGHAVGIRTRQFGWESELRPIFSRDGWSTVAGRSLYLHLQPLVFSTVVGQSLSFTRYSPESIYFFEKGDHFEIASMTLTVARTHAIITQYGVAHSVHVSTSTLGLNFLARFWTAMNMNDWFWHSSVPRSTADQHSHIIMVAPALRLLGGGEVHQADSMVVDPVEIDRAAIDARRRAKGRRVGSRQFPGSHFRRLVTSWGAIDGSCNLCCAHALLGGVGLKPEILELYGCLVERLCVLETESTAGEQARLGLASHVRDGDMPSAAPTPSSASCASSRSRSSSSITQ